MGLAQRLHLPQASDSSQSAAQAHTPLLLRLLSYAAVAGFLFVGYISLFLVGADATQGDVQRIFYVHVAAFSAASCALFCAVIGGIAYLRTRNPKWDALSLAGVEVGFVLSLVTLFCGMVWARPIWNTWWTWDPRLTSAAIMVLVYAAYLMLRGALENPDKRRTLASVYGILAFSTVVFTFVIIRIRPDTIHPTVIGNSAQNAEGGFAMTESMKSALAVASIAWCCFIAPALIWWRIRLERMVETAEELRTQI